MVSFTISEGDDFDYDSFNKDYCNPYISKKELQEKYNLSDGMYYNRSKYATECTGYRRKAGRPTNNMRNIYKRGSHYEIHKTTKRDKRYCGTYPNLKTAYMVRDLLERCDWSYDMINECIKSYGVRKNTHGSNQYYAPFKERALSKYSEFEKLFFKGEDSYYDMLDILGFTRHQYNVCLTELKKRHGKVRKPMVKKS